ncbi:MAG: hypothetical protein V3T64_05795 [Myxococcota bacterium]
MARLPTNVLGLTLGTFGAVATLMLLYAPSLGAGFLSDDLLYLPHNPTFDLPMREALSRIFAEAYFANWSPVHHLLLYVEWSVFGSSPLGYRLVNLLLHAGSCLALFRLVRRAGLGESVAWLAGAIFLIHPVAAEPVAWINQSKTLLATLFSLCAIERWLAHLSNPERSSALVVAWIATVLALLSKPSALPLPALLLLAIWTHSRSCDWRRRLIDWAPIAGVWLGVLLVNLAAQANEGGTASWFGGSPWATAQIVPWLLWRYLRLVVLPFDLVYGVAPDPLTGVFDPRFWLSILALVASAVGLSLAVRRDRRRLLWVAWFVLMLLPVLQLVPMINLFADRYLYVALPAAVLLGSELLVNLGSASSLLWRRAAWAAAIALLTGFVVLTAMRAQAWGTPIRLYIEATEAYPRSRVGCTGLGAERHRGGDLDGAVQAYLRCLELDPEDGHVRHLLGRVRLLQGDTARALFDFEAALRLAPTHYQTREVQRLARRLRARGVEPLADP